MGTQGLMSTYVQHVTHTLPGRGPGLANGKGFFRGEHNRSDCLFQKVISTQCKQHNWALLCLEISWLGEVRV